MYTGLIRESDDDDNILFSPGTRCENWITLPTSMVERVHFVRAVVCGDHTHSLVHVVLAKPQGEEAQAFAAIANAHRGAASAPRAEIPAMAMVAAESFVRPPPPDFKCPDNQTWTWDQTRGWVCMP